MTQKNLFPQKKKKASYLVLLPLIVSMLSFTGFFYFLVTSGKKNESSTKETASDSSNSVLSRVSLLRQREKEEHLLLQSKRRSSTHTGVWWPRLPEPGSVAEFRNYKPLLNAIEKWNPDDPEQPILFVEELQHFNYSNTIEREMATTFRDAEIPFKMYGIPELRKVSSLWTDDYLSGQLKGKTAHVEKSKSNHFMFWARRRRSEVTKNWMPPTDIIPSMPFDRWLALAKQADENKIRNDSVHYYFMSNAAAGDQTNTFVGRDLSMFSTQENNFFITRVEANKGIQCRFGMRGVIAESHFDGGKNMVAMIRGAKRYILTPPSTCKQLDIIVDQRHPSYRHSVIDWSDVEQARSRGFGSVPAIDTIVRQGEILYIPSYWFHYIVSLEYSIQCNSRSGSPLRGEGQSDIEQCLGKKLEYLEKYNRGK